MCYKNNVMEIQLGLIIVACLCCMVLAASIYLLAIMTDYYCVANDLTIHDIFWNIFVLKKRNIVGRESNYI